MVIRSCAAFCGVLLCCALLIPVALAGQAYSKEGASRYIQSNNYQGLADYASAWTRAQPANADAWGFLGMAYGLHLHQPDKAALAIKRSLQLNPNQPSGWNALATTYIDLKQYDDAIQAEQKAIQLNANQPTYWNNLAVAYSDKADWDDARRTLDKEAPVVERLNLPDAWYVLGNGYLKLRNAQQSIAAYRHCVALKPGFAQCWTNMGVMLEWAGNNQEALQAYARGKALGDSMAGDDAGRLNQAIAAQRQAAANPGQRNMGQQAAFLNESFRQQAARAAENRH